MRSFEEAVIQMTGVLTRRNFGSRDSQKEGYGKVRVRR
jgi:hypothetical protein